MALQETHLNDDQVEALEKIYGHLRIFNSASPENETGAGGVAIIINKLLTNHQDVEYLEVMAGRAIVCKLEWHKGNYLSILAVYAPTVKAENSRFWTKVRSVLKKKRNRDMKPEIMLGDFNQVEDAIDRFPARLTPIDSPESFDALKRSLRVSDGWRETFPGVSEWTWRNASRTSMSRIDRIYLTKDFRLASRAWEIRTSNLTKNDHSRIQFELVNPGAPDIGKGRWTMKPALVNDESFLEQSNNLARLAREEMQLVTAETRSDVHNPQVIWKKFKTAVKELAQKIAREESGKRRSMLAKAVAERMEAKRALQAALYDEDVKTASEGLRKAEDKVYSLEDKRFEDKFFYRRMRAAIESETMSKSWFNWPKINGIREPMTSLREPESQPPVYTTSSARMAELGKRYHDEIQKAGITDFEPNREADIASALDPVDPAASGIDFAPLASLTSRDDVSVSIGTAKLGSAAGLDGIIYEFWIALNRKSGEPRSNGETWEDIASIMARVFQDVEVHGVCQGTEFAKGWLCPLYKKGDRADIGNYRPITLLNTDYKILTKSLAIRLARIAPQLIHPDQAGFVSGRSITDQTKLTAMILSYAEATESNGMIVALDQEKAYDRIRHDYLANSLRRYGLPELFVSTVRSLYSTAETAVMINGFLSGKFKVTRGVRQGDPLSCLLFNLAIEPLPNLLRKSALRGYEIDGLKDRLIATLYADDTTVYLSADDDYEELLRILDVWCRAAGAKFNVAKTEIIPLGEPNYRNELILTRKTREDARPIPEGIRIARDGEVTRILGAWPGNGVDNAAAWSKVLEKVQDALDRWTRFNPSLRGRSLISRAIIGGCTQYLTAAQGMPQNVELKLDRMTLSFLWGNARRHPINMETLRALPRFGGINLFCAQERNDAQYLSWLSAYLAPSEMRPLWAFVADHVFRAAMIKTDRSRIPEGGITNPFLQSWRPNVRKLPLALRRMFTVARRYALILDDPYIPENIRLNASVWAHPALGKVTHGRSAAWRARCLKTNHAVRTVEDLEEIAERDVFDHESDVGCHCENCVADRGEGCNNPSGCQTLAEEILALLPERWNLNVPAPDTAAELICALDPPTTSSLEDGEPCLFDKDVGQDRSEWELLRVLGNSLAVLPGTAADLVRRDSGVATFDMQPGEPIHATVCSAIEQGNSALASGGFAVEFADIVINGVYGHLGDPQTTHTGAALDGIRAAAQYAPGGSILHIVTNSVGATRALTVDLRKHEDLGWTDVPGIATSGRLTASALRSRTADTTITYISNDRAKQWPEIGNALWAARGAAYGCPPFEENTAALAPFDRPGVKLVGLTQRTIGCHTILVARCN